MRAQITVVFLADVHSALASEWPRVHREQQAWLKAKAEHDSAAKVLPRLWLHCAHEKMFFNMQ